MNKELQPCILTPACTCDSTALRLTNFGRGTSFELIWYMRMDGLARRKRAKMFVNEVKVMLELEYVELVVSIEWMVFVDEGD